MSPKIGGDYRARGGRAPKARRGHRRAPAPALDRNAAASRPTVPRNRCGFFSI